MASGKYIGLVILWLLSFLLLVLNVIMNVFARDVQRESIGIFQLTVQFIHEQLYEINITPANWTHWYLVAVGAWQLIWLLYGAGFICRKGVDNEPLMVAPELISIPVYILYMFAIALNIGSLFLWDRLYSWQGLMFTGIQMASLWTALGLSCWDLSKNLETLYNNGLEADSWLMRMFVHNGLAIYASYYTFYFFLELNMVIVYVSGYNSNDASTVCLMLLMFFVVVYFILDISVLDHWLRYVFTPYISIAIIFGAIIERNWDAEWLQLYRNPTFVATALGVVCVFALTKILIMSVKGAISPIKEGKSQESLIDEERHY